VSAGEGDKVRKGEDALVGLDRLELDRRVVVGRTTRRTLVVEVLLDVMVAEAADLRATRGGPKEAR